MSDWSNTIISTDQIREKPPQGVEPIDVFRLKNGEVIRPGRDRFSLDHDLVIKYPERFRPIAGCTERTRARFRDMLARAERALEHGQVPGAHLTRTREPSSAPDPERRPRALRPLRLPGDPS
jgi:hypothetical protein